MRIVYVLNSLGIGGAERQALAIADRMARRGHTVAVLVLCPRLANEWPTTLPVVHLDILNSPLSFLRGMVRASRFLRDFRPNLLHSHSFHSNIAARLLKLLNPTTSVISTVHNVYEGGRLRMLAYRLTDSLARRTTAVSQAAADRFIRLKAIPGYKCLVVPNGIDIAEFSPSPERRAQTRAAMGVTAEFVWLAAGRLVPAKDFPNLLAAFDRVQAAFPDTQLWIAGDPRPSGAAAADGFVVDRASSTDRDTLERVRWLGLRRDMLALLDAADAFVQASAWEGMPLAVGEAMGMEKSVVATDAGGTREIVGEAGVIVPARNSQALAAAMIDLMQSPEESRKALGHAAHTRIADKFSIESRAGAWEALYRLVVDAHH